MISVEAQIIELSNGTIKRVVIGNAIYQTDILGFIQEGEPEEYFVPETQEEQDQIDNQIARQNNRGREIKEINGTKIFENVYFDVRAVTRKNYTMNDVYNVISKYYDPSDYDIKEIGQAYLDSCSRRTSKRIDLGPIVYQDNKYKYYKKIIDEIKKKGEPIEKIIREHYPHVEYKTVNSYARKYRSFISKQNQRVQKDDIEPEDGIVGRSKKYQRKVTKAEYDAVNKCIHRFNFIAKTKSISKETGLDLQKVRAVLDLMRERNKIKLVKSIEKGVYYIPT